MKILNFGSLILDYVYQVEHFVRPGETLQAQEQTVNCGGKGLNQSIAMAKAGAAVFHVGCIGIGGERLEKELRNNFVNTGCLSQVDRIQGSAVIQVNEEGENCILLYGGMHFWLHSCGDNTLLMDSLIEAALDTIFEEC